MENFDVFKFTSVILFLLGLFLLNGGVRVVRKKEYLAVGRFSSFQNWSKPRLLTGKQAVYYGVQYIIEGVFLIVLSAGLYYATIYLRAVP